MLVCAGARHTVAQEMLTNLTSYKVSVLVSVPVALIKYPDHSREKGLISGVAYNPKSSETTCQPRPPCPVVPLLAPHSDSPASVSFVPQVPEI